MPQRQNRKTAASGHLAAPDSTLQKALNQAGLATTNHCFGCAPANRYGLRLRFHQNEADRGVECTFRMPRRFQGPPGHVHGGIIAAILDEAMSKANRQKGIVALTRQMSIEYLRPVPLGVKLRAVGWPVKEDGRKHTNAAEIRTPDGVVLARGEGLFIAIDPAEMLQLAAAQKLENSLTTPA